MLFYGLCWGSFSRGRGSKGEVLLNRLGSCRRATVCGELEAKYSKASMATLKRGELDKRSVGGE